MSTVMPGVTNFGSDPRASELAYELADRLLAFDPTLDRAQEDAPVEGTGPLEILGAGLIAHNGGVMPVILTSVEAAPLEGTAIGQLPRVARVIDALMHRSMEGRVLVRGIRPPHLHAGAGEPCWATADGDVARGTFGPFIRDRAGRPGIMIAGHVARQSGSPVSDVVGAWGIATNVRIPESKARPSADCAIVEPLLDLPRRSADFVIASTAIPDPDAPITSYGANAVRSSRVELFAEWLYIPEAGSSYARVYKTYEPVSSSGDSGAPVLLSESSSLVGTIVAGSEGESYFQAIDYQLHALEATLDSP